SLKLTRMVFSCGRDDDTLMTPLTVEPGTPVNPSCTGEMTIPTARAEIGSRKSAAKMLKRFMSRRVDPGARLEINQNLRVNVMFAVEPVTALKVVLPGIARSAV